MIIITVVVAIAAAERMLAVVGIHNAADAAPIILSMIITAAVVAFAIVIALVIVGVAT